MQQILLFILLGLGSGALIAGIALGVVLTYRGSGVINLATGGMAMLAGYAFWALRTDQLGVHLATTPALVASLAFAMFIGALIELVAFRPLRTAAPLAELVSSLGVLLVLQAAMLLAFGTTQQPEPAVLPQNTVAMFGAVVPVDRFILAGIVVVAAGSLGGSVPIHELRPGDARCIRERGRGNARGTLAEFALDVEHDACVVGRRGDRDPRRVDHPA